MWTFEFEGALTIPPENTGIASVFSEIGVDGEQRMDYLQAMQIEPEMHNHLLAAAILPPTISSEDCKCEDLCHCPPTMTRAQAMSYCQTRLVRATPGSGDHSIYTRLLRKGQLFEAKDAFVLAQTAFRETSRGEYV